ncbi:MAG: putative lipoprotein YbbD precursor [Firmicutes bacterium ADurb.Bin248]|nr:MAG: putative lipoprotein YbbD precursor [Firmicutes bacterium ADurb.Bin248]HOG01339.1 beta-N-acetylhexosaminidase [Clostridia bacterium]HPK14577.1 beta-N-acetylhexosaminidase [Clostridia bacterium]
MKDLIRQAGARLMTFVPGPRMTEDYKAFACEYGLCNFILFGDDIENARQLGELCAQLDALARENTGMGALVAIDQEGGRVQRLPRDMLDTPAAASLAQAGGERAYETGRLIARTLLAHGVNFDLAPVLDVEYENGNPVVGDRSFGKTPEQAARLGVAMLEGIATGGALACAKHFPGHGGTRLDSHLALPTLDYTLDELRAGPLIPFAAAVAAGARAIMSAHILFPNIDPERPATLSRRLLTGLLREEMDFSGLILTDCLEMGAMSKHFGTAYAAKEAAKAGADILLVSHTREFAAETVETLAKALADGELDRAEHERSLERIREAKRWLGL